MRKVLNRKDNKYFYKIEVSTVNLEEKVKELEEKIVELEKEIKESDELIEALQAACAGRLG